MKKGLRIATIEEKDCAEREAVNSKRDRSQILVFISSRPEKCRELIYVLRKSLGKSMGIVSQPLDMRFIFLT